MSRNGWEAGTLQLPTAAVAPVRKALREAANAYHDQILRECLRLWSGPLAKTSSRALYQQRLSAALRSSSVQSGVAEAVYHVMDGILVGGKSPRTPRAADVECVAPKANTRTTSFGGYADEWHIKLDGAKLSYHSGDNNHQVEKARAHPVVRAMLGVLRRIHWTRGTGGVFTGNDEYNRESSYAGGGGNYITEAYGPRGEEEKAFSMGLSVLRYRALMRGSASRLRR